MTWLAWRQFRTSLTVVTGLVAAVALTLLATRPGLAGLARSTGLDQCATSCAEQAATFLTRAGAGAGAPLYFLTLAAVYAIPGIIGVFWGAPMIARELESGTFRLVWSQSTTRSRWLAVKLAAGAGAAMVSAGLLSLAVTWWSAPFDKAYDNILDKEVFGARGVVPIAYAALAFVLGALIGTVLRRTVPAMALTLALIAAVQVVLPSLVRPHLIPPETWSAPITEENAGEVRMSVNDGFINVTPELDKPGAWVLENEAVTASGEVFDGPYDQRFCGRDATAGRGSCTKWVASQNLRQEAVYQPADRFWPLQWIESALMLVVAVLLTALCFWWVRRRLT